MSIHRNAPIIYVEDDADDREIFAEILKESSTPNPLLCFKDAETFLSYLYETNDQPLIIFCDINLPGMTGIALRREMISNDVLKKKAIPFVYFSTGPIPQQIDTAHELNVQGHFLKRTNAHTLSATVRMIIRYWSESLHSTLRIKVNSFLL